VQVKRQKDEIENYLTDASFLPGGHAEGLFVPDSIDDISAVLLDASKTGTAVTVAGSRTGTVGGAIPFGGFVLSMERMNRIRSVDKGAMTADVEAGVILGDVQKAVDAAGLYYPPDPTEWSCQIGGNVATNASGSRSFRYGSTRRWVEALKVVLPQGDTLELVRGTQCFADGEVTLGTNEGNKYTIKAPTYHRPNVSKNVSGYYTAADLDPIDLFIGSEGTLGVVAEATLKLIPKPEGFLSGIVFFADETDLLSFVDAARGLSLENRAADASPSALNATLLEYFDGNSLEFIRQKFPETPDGIAGAVYFEQETSAETEEAILGGWHDLLEKNNADLDRSWFATNDQDREKMRRFRHALPLSCNERFAKYGFKKVSTDMAVPVDRFRSFLRFYEEILGSCGIDYVIFGHIGDCHLHVNLFPKTEAEAEQARHVYGRCVAQAIMLGGTVSAEHGTGKLKRKYLAAMMGERYLNEMAAIKSVLDPNGILGRGNMFDESYL
jgi:D-lactate dehydrogenase (cytochrome)